ncbi:PQQ-dependent sugar dehydrogenase [Aeromicrobium sp. 179-A 4D2 NHS]|uniref:PQQ-dependent sugar dehydrogenase n=1 Tax=Aeromicrobium sp. 179-A 4D2 NHS TaxID=3142375 RepID=UPI0039A0C269
MDRRHLILGGTALGAAWLAGCRSDESEPSPSPSTSPSATPSPSPTSAAPRPIEPRVEGTIATGLNVPWAIVFLSDGTALVTQRDEGSIVRVTADGDVTKVGDVPGVAPGGEGGLQGLAVAPGDESALYAYLTSEEDNRVVRLEFDGERLGRAEPILTGLRKAFNHQGGALTFDRAGHLFVAVGDAADPGTAQDRDPLNGKILRIDTQGRPVDGNPFGNEVWSYGHRNVEGLAWDGSGRLWASEFGDKSADEVNRIVKGGNYGWPDVEGRGGGEGVRQPLATWDVAEASPAGIAISGDRAFVAALRGQRLWQVPLDGGEPRAFLTQEHGRLRSVAVAPDGSLWLGTSNTDGRATPRRGDDRLLRVAISA